MIRNKIRWMQQNKALILIIGITIAGFILRLWQLGEQSFWMDEGYSVLAAMQTLVHGYPLLDSGFVYSRGIIHNYVMAGSIWLFGLSEFSARLPSVIAGTAFIPVIYFIVKKMFSYRAGLLTAAFVAFSSYEIAWSRQARMYIFLQLFFFLSVYFYWKFYNNPNVRDGFWCLLFIALSISIHQFGALALPVFALHFLIINIHKPREFLRMLKGIVRGIVKNKIYVLLTLAVCGWIVLQIKGMPGIMNTRVNYIGQYWNFLTGGFGRFIWLAVIGFIVTKKKKEGLLLVMCYSALFLILSYFLKLLHYRYLFFVLPVLFILTSESLVYPLRWFRDKRIKTAILGVFLIIILIVQHNFVLFPKEFYYLEPETPQPDFKSAYGYVAQNLNDSLLVASHPAMARIYYRKADYWLGFDYSNMGKVDHWLKGDKKREVYDNLKPILSYDDLIGINQSFVIVVDDMAQSRIGKEVVEFMQQNMTLEKVFGNVFWNRVWVYRFDGDGEE
ncbi:MAG: glycosyltransferase family 39 protein [Nanoarchaeota archaeon]|nr:glycosyltransferase family 39 protein [Nanoarchaeota archaeon]